MKANGGGAIVNNASVAGLVGLAMQGAYSGTKHAVIGMTKAAAAEAAPEQVRVNAICPGATRTPILTHLLEAGISEDMLAEMAAQKRLAEPKEIAAAACRLLSDAASYKTGAAMPDTIWVSGCTNWYIGEKGIPSAWPFTGARFRKELKKPDFNEYLASG